MPFHFFKELLSLVYPPYCIICEIPLVEGESIICTRCTIDYTHGNTRLYENHIKEKFLPDQPLIRADALCTYTKKGGMTKLVRKVKEDKAIAEKVGRHLGLLWAKHTTNPPINMVVPIPMHHTKLRLRGFNQSTALARGLAHSIGKPLVTSFLKKKVNTEEQKKQTKEQRYRNQKNAFAATGNGPSIKGKHILLVDDLITTGATLKAVGDVLLEEGVAHLSVATLALTI